MLKTKQYFLMVLATIVIFMTFVGCVKTDSTLQNNSQAPVELSIFIGDADVACNRSDTPVIREMEKKTNTKLNFIESPKGQADQKVALLIAGGEMPDITNILSINIANNYAINGAFIPLDDQFDKSLPNAKKRIPIDVMKMLKASDGKVYSLPLFRDIGSKSIFIREDWLKKLNMKMPETLDEYYEVLKAFKMNDPDGNGKNDTYGLSIDDYAEFVAPFGIPVDDWIIDENGLAVRSSVTPKMKEAIAFAQKLFKEGIIDPEFATQNAQRRDEKSINSVYGVRTMYTTSAASQNMNIEKATSGGKFVRMTIPKAPGVTKGIIGSDYAIDGATKRIATNATCVSKSSKNLESCFKYLDWLFTDEGSRVVTYGIEGATYSMENNKPKFMPEYIGKENMGKRASAGLWDKYAFCGYIDQIEGWEQAYGNETAAIMKDSVKNSGQKIMLTNTPIGESIQGELNKTRLEIMTKIIMGSVSVDEGWNQWLKEFDRLGGNKWTKEVNEVLSTNK